MDISHWLNKSTNSRTRNENHSFQHDNTHEYHDYDQPCEAKGIIVRSIMFSETGTYNKEYLRPWAVSVDRDVIGVISDIADESLGKVSRDNLAGIAGNMLRYSSEVTNRDLVNIENSWDNVRQAVIFEIEEPDRSLNGNPDEVTYITGFTDRLDISNSEISPDTRIYVTNIFRVKRSSRMLTSSQQLVSPNFHNAGKFMKNQDALFTVRPKDCFNNELSAVASAGYNNINYANSLIGTSIRSSRTNNLSPSSYMAASINAIVDGMSQNTITDGFGVNLSGSLGGRGRVDDQTLLQSASAAVREETAIEHNSFLHVLRRESDTFSSESVFTWGDLLQMFGNDLYRVTQHNRRKQVRANSDQKSRWSQAGECAAWDNTESYGYNAVIATAFKQAIPAYAIESLIYSCRVELTNYNGVGGDMMDSYDGFLVTVSNVIFVAKMPDIRTENQLIERFKNNIARRIARDVSINNTIFFDLIAEVDWRYDSFYDVSVDGGQPVEYSTAAFAASLTSPIITFDNEFASNLVADVRNIAAAITDIRR